MLKLQEAVNLVKNSRAKIIDSGISNALRTGYLDKTNLFKEVCIAKHERFGSVILQEMNLEEMQSEFRGLVTDDDVSEDGMILSD